mgnify:FL=1
MGFSWAILLYVMADVMGLGHGGDGAGDPPPPVGFGRGQHEQDGKSYYDIFVRCFDPFIISYRD